MAWADGGFSGSMPVDAIAPNGVSWSNETPATIGGGLPWFMRVMEQRFPNGFMCVKMTHSGSGITGGSRQWAQASADLWTQMEQTWAAVLSWANTNSYNIEPSLIVWSLWQGTLTESSTFEADECQFIADVRNFLGGSDGSSIPVVITPTLAHPSTTLDTAAISTIQTAKDSNVASDQLTVAPTLTYSLSEPLGIEFNPDNLALSARGLMNSGFLTAEAVEQLATQPGETSGNAATLIAYCSLEEAEQIIARYGTPTSWSSKTEAQKIQSLNNGARYVDSKYGASFKGVQTEYDQLRPWPRKGVVAHCVAVDSSAIPPAVKEADVLAALEDANGTALFPVSTDSGSIEAESVTVGPIEISTEYSGSSNPAALPVISQVRGVLKAADLLGKRSVTVG